MTPLSFDHDTAREVTGDAMASVIEAQARADADAGVPNPPQMEAGATYWSGVQSEMRRIVYRAQYAKRAARNERKAAQTAKSAGVQ